MYLKNVRVGFRFFILQPWNQIRLLRLRCALPGPPQPRKAGRRIDGPYPPTILTPSPFAQESEGRDIENRFRKMNKALRQESSAVALHARICAGALGDQRSYRDRCAFSPVVIVPNAVVGSFICPNFSHEFRKCIYSIYLNPEAITTISGIFITSPQAYSEINLLLATDILVEFIGIIRVFLL
jgi:hypothetical protein